jgi:hypothetical protein
VKPERKYYQEIRKSWKNFNLTRIENLSVPGVPDLLVYNKNHFFFTVELKVATREQIRLSPHQIAFHVKHPINSFILVKSLASGLSYLYEGEKVEQLDACGLSLEPLVKGDLDACRLLLEELGGWAELDGPPVA